MQEIVELGYLTDKEVFLSTFYSGLEIKFICDLVLNFKKLMKDYILPEYKYYYLKEKLSEPFDYKYVVQDKDKGNYKL